MGFCVNCGTALPQGAKFCPKCGTDMRAWQKQFVPAAQSVPETPVIPQPEMPVVIPEQVEMPQEKINVAPVEQPVAIWTEEPKSLEEEAPVKGKAMLTLGKVLSWIGFGGSVFSLISSGIFVLLMICLDNIQKYYGLTAKILLACGEALVLSVLAAVFIGVGEKKSGLKANGCKRLSWVSIVLAAVAAAGAVLCFMAFIFSGIATWN